MECFMCEARMSGDCFVWNISKRDYYTSNEQYTFSTSTIICEGCQINRFPEYLMDGFTAENVNMVRNTDGARERFTFMHTLRTGLLPLRSKNRRLKTKRTIATKVLND